MILTNSQKIRYGEEYLKAWLYLVIREFKSFSLSYDEVKQEVLKNNPDYLIEIGEAAAQSGFGLRRTRESADRVIYKLSDKIPTSFQMIQGLTEELESYDFSLLGDAALNIGSDLVETVKSSTNKVTESVSDAFTGVTDTISIAGKSLKYVFIGIVAILVFALYSRVKK